MKEVNHVFPLLLIKVRNKENNVGLKTTLFHSRIFKYLSAGSSKNVAISACLTKLQRNVVIFLEKICVLRAHFTARFLAIAKIPTRLFYFIEFKSN